MTKGETLTVQDLIDWVEQGKEYGDSREYIQRMAIFVIIVSEWIGEDNNEGTNNTLSGQ